MAKVATPACNRSCPRYPFTLCILVPVIAMILNDAASYAVMFKNFVGKFSNWVFVILPAVLAIFLFFSGGVFAKALSVARSSVTILDSGASHCFFNSERFFSRLAPSTHLVELAAGAISVDGVGPTEWCDESLYVPSFSKNLVAVRPVCRDRNACICMDASRAVIVPRDDVLFKSEPVIIAEQVDGLYQITKKCARAFSAFVKGDARAKIDRLHRRMGHASMRTIVNAIRDGFLVGIVLTRAEMRYARNSYTCPVCLLYKAKRIPRRRGFASEDEAVYLIPLLTVHLDGIGPFSPISRRGFRYVLSFTDRATRYVIAFCTKRKADYLQALRLYKPRVEAEFARLTGRLHKLHTTVSDYALEFRSVEWNDFHTSNGMEARHSAPYSPDLNGLEEKNGGDVVRTARTMCAAAPHVPLELWPYSIYHATYCKNRNPCSWFRPRVSPYQKLTFRAPDCTHLHEYGERCLVTLVKPEIQKGKLGQTAHVCYFLCRSPDSMAYKVYDPVSNKVLDRKDVTFPKSLDLVGSDVPRDFSDADAHVRGPRLHVEGLDDSDDEFEGKGIPEMKPKPVDSKADRKRFALLPRAPPNVVAPNVEDIPERKVEESELDDVRKLLAEDDQRLRRSREAKRQQVEEECRNDVSPRVRSRRTRRPPGEWWKASANSARIARAYAEALAAGLRFNREPKTVAEALAIDRATHTTHWADAIRYEFRRCIKMGLWRCRSRKRSMHVITTRWVFKIKNPGTKFERYRARLVAHGYKSLEGVEFNADECFAPVARYESIRILLSLAAEHNLILHDIDVKSAYLFAKLPTPTYIELPDGYPVETIPSDVTDPILQLDYALYGLKNSGHLWNRQFDEYLQSIGCVRMASDTCCYKLSRDKSWLVFALFVDNLFVAATDDAIVQWLIKRLSEKYEITNGPLEQALGMEITRASDGSISLTCREYIKKLAKRFGVDRDAKNLPDTPLPAEFSCSKIPRDVDTPVVDKSLYFQLVGCLNRCSHTCRPDIAYAAFALSRFNIDPQKRQLAYARHCVRYLVRTIGKGIVFSKNSAAHPFIAFTDSSFNCFPSTSKSMTGFVVFLYGNAILWGSMMHSLVAFSPNEAEYIALCDGSKATIFMTNFIKEVGLHASELIFTFVFGDNLGANGLAAQPSTTKRNRHIRLQFHAVRDMVFRKEIAIQYVNTHDQVADVLTKSLDAEKHAKFVRIIMEDGPSVEVKVPSNML